MKFAGLDACKVGWVATVNEGEAYRCHIYPTVSDFWGDHNDVQRVFIDIPIGFPTDGNRPADSDARAYLPSHLKSSIFNTPVRESLYASTKAEAKEANKTLTGKSLSEQSMGLFSKIREVDSFLLSTTVAQGVFYESHPEVCFCHCAGSPLHYAKKDLLGGIERLKILRKYVPEAESLLQLVRKSYPRSKVAADDVLDAMILAVTAKESNGLAEFFPIDQKKPMLDDKGLAMAIWFYGFHRR